MKKVLEVLVCILLPPIGTILMWINVIGRRDLTGLQKAIWIVLGILMIIAPIIYVLLGGGDLW